jgi:hypothetical protein
MVKTKSKTEYDSKTQNLYKLDHLQVDAEDKSSLETTIKKVKKELRNWLIKRKELIKRLGNVFESVVSNPESVCEEIKNSLRDEIRDKIISARDIERYCPDKWKKKTKPKNDNLSFSRTSEQKPQQQIAVTQEGKSVIMNDTSANTEAYPSDGDDEPRDQSKQNGTGTNDANNEERTADTDTNEELVVTYSLNDEIAPANKQNEGMTDRKEMFVSHISMSLADLQKDIDAVSQTTKGEGNIFFEVLVDLGTHEVKIEFCGITQQKDVTMTSTGKGILKESNLKAY